MNLLQEGKSEDFYQQSGVHRQNDEYGWFPNFFPLDVDTDLPFVIIYSRNVKESLTWSCSFLPLGFGLIGFIPEQHLVNAASSLFRPRRFAFARTAGFFVFHP